MTVKRYFIEFSLNLLIFASITYIFSEFTSWGLYDMHSRTGVLKFFTHTILTTALFTAAWSWVGPKVKKRAEKTQK